MARIVLLLFYFVLPVWSSSPVTDTVTLETKLGKIKGLQLESEEGRDFLGFTGIPFAKPPVGKLRFQPPQVADSWGNEAFDATKAGNDCPQLNFMTHSFEGQEDCLVLNVYTPYVQKDRRLPVLVFIHGGAFVFGSSAYNMYGPQRFMEHDVVLVTIQYRLGLLGFLNTEDSEATGNYGMLDQVMALRWVKKNIEDYGGDKKRITIFGESAGGASINYHLISPLSKGLFDGAIAQSGSTLTHWALQKTPLEWAKKIAGVTDCPTDTTKKMVDCFRGKSAAELVKGNSKLRLTGFMPFYAAPSIDVHGKQVFLPQEPLKLLQEGKVNNVPVIQGMTTDEGYIFYRDLVLYIENKHEDFFDKHAQNYFPTILDVESHMSSTFDRIRKEYFSDVNEKHPETFETVMTKVVGHIMFDAGIAQTVDLLHKAGVPVRTYVYNQLSNISTAVMFAGEPGKYVCHADDTYLQFVNKDLQALKHTDNDFAMAKLLNTIWVNFAAKRYDSLVTVAKEVIEWPLHAEQKPQYLELTVRPRIKEGPLCDKVEFWAKTIPKLVDDHRVRDEL